MPPVAAPHEPLLHVEDLRVGFPGRAPVVRGVGFDVYPGEVLALVGESGAGKSLTARAVLGLAPRGATVSGRVALGGAPVTAADLGRRLAWIPQDAMSALSPVHRVDTQLALAVRAVATAASGARLRRGEARGVARRALADVGLSGRAATEFPHALSGGMRQRAVIAMALVNRPELVVADEPTTALDPARREQVLGLLRERCAATGTALLLVSHDLAAVRRHADRVAVMYAGRLVEFGPAAQVLGRPLAPYTRGLLASVPTPGLPNRSRLPALEGAPPLPGPVDRGCAFAPRCAHTAAVCRDEEAGPRPVDGRLIACHHPLDRPDGEAGHAGDPGEAEKTREAGHARNPEEAEKTREAGHARNPGEAEKTREAGHVGELGHVGEVA